MPNTLFETPRAAETFLRDSEKGLWISNKYVEAVSGETIESFNPATGEKIAKVSAAGADDVDIAVASAREAFDGHWSRITPDSRGRLLYDLAAAIEEHAEELAELETLDNGKPLSASRRDDLPLAASLFRYYAGWTTKHVGHTIPVSSGNFHCYTRNEPVGVCAGIIPWNYPLVEAAMKLAPALACGNVMIVKPAEETPVSILRLAELIRDTGFPPGVVNVLNGHGETCGAVLARHSGVDKVSFTGSTAVGQKIVEASAGNLKRVSLELGGKSPNIVFGDAPEGAVEGASWAINYNSGQECTAGSRIFVEASKYDDFVASLVSETEKLKVGPGLDPGTDLGPLVSPDQLQRVLGYVELAQREGATLETGGHRLVDEARANGNFIAPAILTDTTNDMKVVQEEIFGPVVAVMPFKSEEELVGKANDTLFGLGAGIWTSDVTRAHRIAAAVKAGTVWVNCYAAADPAAPFGGYKMSGYGRELGSNALDDYTETKCVWINLD
ncbi:aldehyde dehydrogenase family protein [Gordonia sp. TBRC 11910]|uniref:Aldehyde dehydrogenase family protein n=1 Tax=Gordonia asplenii TaxID=2725283 RepID=A0A848KRI9_9ACTN|nr:aldehyde dehydrogenase family protein [Gordonia asplenii]NMO00872.1 aldehyde dehydrogenase family protein [Gordonia asplenii]